MSAAVSHGVGGALLGSPVRLEGTKFCKRTSFWRALNTFDRLDEPVYLSIHLLKDSASKFWQS